MPERLTVTPLEARIILFNEIFTIPYGKDNRHGHYNEAIARMLHGSLYRAWFKPEYRSLKPEDIMHDTQRSQLFCDRVDQILETITDRERVATKIHFGLDDGTLHTLEEVGKEFGVTGSRIQQIESKVLRKLKHPSKSKFLEEFLPKNQ